MSTIKNGLISVYCHFNKIIKGPGTSSSSPALSQKHVTLLFDQFSFSQCLGFRRNKHNCNFHYIAMPMVTSQILKSGFHKNAKIQISREQNIIFLQIKKFINYISKVTLWHGDIIRQYYISMIVAKNSFVAEVTFKEVVEKNSENENNIAQKYKSQRTQRKY